jgi:hypothetical protein
LPCGVFSVRKIVGMESYAGIVPLDFDGFISRAEAAAFKVKVSRDAHVYSNFISPSGRGVKAFLHVPDRKHAFNYEMAACYCNEQWGREPDPSGKDVSRLCFLSHDPDPHWNPAAAVLQFNHNAWLRDSSIEGPPIGKSSQYHNRREKLDFEEDDTARGEGDRQYSGREASYDLVKAAVDAIDDSYAEAYEDWLHVGFGLHWWGAQADLQDEARDLFHIFSEKCAAKYSPSEVDAKWESFEQSSRWVDSDAVTIGTVFYYAVESGFEFPALRGRDQQRRPRHGDDE